MQAITILPDKWRVYFDEDGELIELGEAAPTPEATSVFVIAPVPLDLSLVGLSGRRLNETSTELMERAHEIVIAWEGVRHPRSVDPTPWSEETVAKLPRTVLAALITYAQGKTWGGTDTEGNESSAGGPMTRSSGGTDTTVQEAAPSGASS